VATAEWDWNSKENGETNQCLCCDEVEQATHIVICLDPNRQEVWMEAVDGLADWFVLTKMEPELSQCICNRLRQWEVEAKFGDHACRLLNCNSSGQVGHDWMAVILQKDGYQCSGRKLKRFTTY